MIPMSKLILIFVPFLFLLTFYLSPHTGAEEDRVIIVAGDDSLPPFSYMNKNGEWTGFSVNLFKAVADVEGIEVKYVPMEFYKAMEALDKGSVDVVIGLKYTAERDRSLDFSDSYFTISEAIIVPKQDQNTKHLTDLRGKVVAIQSQHVAFDLLKDVRREQVNIAQSQKDAIDLLLMDKADVFVGNRWTAQYYLEELGKNNDYKVTSNPIQPADYAFAVQGGNTDLLKVLNHGLLTVRANGTYGDIYSQWFNKPYSKMLHRMKSIVFILLSILAIVGTVLIIGFIWNKRLKQEVMKQTRALKDANVHLESSKREIANQGAFKEQILSNVPSGIVTFDLNWNMTSMNKKAERGLLIENNWKDHVIIQSALQAYKNKEKSVSKEVEFNQSGNLKHFFYHYRPLLNVNHEKTGYLLIFENRTEEKKLQDKLLIQEKMRALGQLSAGVAHEMRNPLTSIKTFIELLPNKYDNDSFRDAIQEHLPEEVERLNNIIEDLLEYSRPKAPKQQLFSVKAWFDTIVVLFEPTLKNEKINFSIEIDPQLTIFADEQQLKQVVVNMILNAIDAMKGRQEKQLKLISFSTGHYTTIQVQDTGQGMTQQELAKCYDPFYTTKPEGVGLGMTICFKIIKENDGEIEIDSRYGKGTTIQIKLPRELQQRSVDDVLNLSH